MANEVRLIDANALLEKLKRSPRYFNIKFDIEEAPTVDAVEVVHGRWVSTLGEEPFDSYFIFRCSACGNPTTWFTAENANYCPNCGAKMDGDKKCE